MRLLRQVILFGICLAAFSATADKEFVMPRMQRNTYLSHAKPPKQFGLSVHQEGDKLFYKGQATITQLRPVSTNEFLTGPIPVIPARGAAGKPIINALLDTSSPASWMEFATSQKLNATFLAVNNEPLKYEGSYNTGEAPAYAAVVPEFHLNSLSLSNYPLYIRMALHSLGPMARGIEQPRIDCVLGYDLLSSFEYIHLDFKNGTVSLSRHTEYEPVPKRLMTTVPIVHTRDYGLAVEGSIMGASTPVILDIAGDYHFSRGDKKVKTTRQVSIGDVVYRKVPTLLLPTHDGLPRAGRKMLEQYTVTICPNKGLVYFEQHSD